MNHTTYLTREHRLIGAIKGWTGERLIGDDCALLPGGQLATVDALVEGTHFVLPGIRFDELGWKSMAVNLSDIAAAAGRPRFALVCLTLPDHITEPQVEQLYAGMLACARQYRCRVIGGDLCRGKQVVVSITLLADAHEQGSFTRGGAQPGDVLIVTGDFGASAAGLWLMKNGTQGNFEHCRQKHFRPQPRLQEAWQLVEQTKGRGAMMDASDGLADAVVQIASASGVTITVDAEAVPIADDTRKVAKLAETDALNWALYGGEDYELVSCIGEQDWNSLQARPGCPFRAIGRISAGKEGGKQTLLKRANGKLEEISLEKTFQHWTANS